MSNQIFTQIEEFDPDFFIAGKNLDAEDEFFSFSKNSKILV
ncbi:hypothetical protein [Microcoleus sp. FACHB-68]|nr:hypothetical protein [Microcoleus sp. FACHB-68]